MVLVNYEMNKMTWAILMPLCGNMGLCCWTGVGQIELKITLLWIILLYRNITGYYTFLSVIDINTDIYFRYVTHLCSF